MILLQEVEIFHLKLCSKGLYEEQVGLNLGCLKQFNLMENSNQLQDSIKKFSPMVLDQVEVVARALDYLCLALGY